MRKEYGSLPGSAGLQTEFSPQAHRDGAQIVVTYPVSTHYSQATMWAVAVISGFGDTVCNTDDTEGALVTVLDVQ